MQFSIRTLFVISTVIAVFCAIFFAVPVFVEIPVLAIMALVAPSVWICGAYFAKGQAKAFFIGGICAGWIPSACLLYYGVAASESVFDGDYFADFAGEDYDLTTRTIMAVCFLLPGFIAFLGGGAGALVYRWFGTEKQTQAIPIIQPPADSRFAEPYVLIESRVTPLESSQLAAPR